MVGNKVLALAVFLGSLLVLPANAQKILLLPGAGSSVSVIANNTFTAGAPIEATSGASTILANPQSTRFFIVSSNDITVADASGAQVQAPVSVGMPIAAVAVTPDGQKVLVAAGTETSGTLYVFDISTGKMEQSAAVAVGANPSGVASSIDSTAAYVVAASGLKRVDLTDNEVTNTLTLSGVSYPNSKVVAAPNGLLYVNADGAVYEVSPRTMTLHKAIVTSGAFPRKPAFSPDGKTMLLANPSASDSNEPVLMTVDLGTYAITHEVTYYGVKFENLIWAKADTYYAYSGSHDAVFELTDALDGLESTAVFPLVGKIANVEAVFASSEFPTDSVPGPRYLYVMTGTTLYRIDLTPPSGATPSQITRSIAISPPSPGGFYFAPASQPSATIGGIFQYGDNQTVSGGARSLPLVIRVVDTQGRPISGIPVKFVSSAGTIDDAMASTNGEGLAQAVLTAPTAGGELTVTATAGSSDSVTFTLNGSGGGNVPGPGGSGIQIISGQGQVMQGQQLAPEPLTVAVHDTSGAPVEGASVQFDVGAATGNGILSGTGCTVSGGKATCKTNENGLASVRYRGPSVSDVYASWVQVKVTATISDADGHELKTLEFFETSVPETVFAGQYTGPLQFQKLLTPSVQYSTISVQAGDTAQDAIKVLITAQSGPKTNSPIPNVGLAVRPTQALDLSVTSPAYCAGGTALSGDDGVASCDLAVPTTTKPGVYQIFAVVAGNTPLTFNLEVSAAPPPVPVATTVAVVSGNNQSGALGQILSPLVAVVKDQFGAIMANQTVQWTVASGSATLTSPGTKTDASGQTSTGVTLGSTQGAVAVKVTAGTASATFNLTATVAIGNVAIVSGNGQSVVLGDEFQPVTVKVTDNSGNAVAGVPVEFKVTGGGATPASDTDVTDVSGVASATFTAPASPGQVTIAATVGGKTASFTLSARKPGPVLTADSFLNGASMQPGVAFGSIVAIKGEGLTTGLTIPPGTCLTTVPDGNLERGLPTELAGISVQFSTQVAPIFAICKNLDNSEQVNVQAPFELAPATITAMVRTGIGTANEMTTFVDGVKITNALPGIFEYNVTSSTRAAVALRPDGTVVSPTNKAKRGEVIRVFTTGLGPVLPVGNVPVKTNQPGYPGQKPFFATSVQLGGSGAPGVTAEYAQNLIGVFVVTFQVPSDAQLGDAVPLVVSVLADGQNVSSRPSTIPISD